MTTAVRGSTGRGMGESRSRRPLPSARVTVVLFTCAGQRVDIVTAFGRAGATTLAVDANELAPALYHADRRALVPRVDDPGYIDALRALVELHDVRLIVPLTDLDHVLLSEHRDELGALVLLAAAGDDPAAARTSTSRTASSSSAASPSPPTWLPDELPDDVRVPGAREGAPRLRLAAHLPRGRPRASSTSSSATRRPTRWCSSVLPGEEFSIDVFCDLEARCLDAIPRTMIESKGGESIKGMTIKDCGADRARRAASPRRSASSGPANIQCFREADGSLPVTDVNPRFGGGFPLPTAAGSRYPELALALANGERPEPRLGDFREGVVMTRFFSRPSCRRRRRDARAVRRDSPVPRSETSPARRESRCRARARPWRCRRAAASAARMTPRPTAPRPRPLRAGAEAEAAPAAASQSS